MKRFFAGFLVAVIFIWPAPAYSATVVYDGTDTYVTGITDIVVVGGVHYNVDFVHSTFNDIWSAPRSGDPLFWGDSSGALGASVAINTVLNEEIINPEIGPPLILDLDGDVYFVPFQLYPEDSSEVDNIHNYTNMVPVWKNHDSFVRVDKNASWYHCATFVAVPIPGALWLLGSGLIGIVGIRRKFRK